MANRLANFAITACQRVKQKMSFEKTVGSKRKKKEIETAPSAFLEALSSVAKEKEINPDILFRAVDAALVSAYKKNFKTATQNVRVSLNHETGEIHVYALKTVVPDDAFTNEATEISLTEAQKINPDYLLEDILEVEVTPKTFGRIAAQAAKQVVVQKIREAERGNIYEEFSSRAGEIVSGIVLRIENRNIFVSLGKTEAILTYSEQIRSEHYSQGDRLKAYVLEVRRTTKSPQVLLSRSHPGFLKRLFELEVPEIFDGIVEIKSIAREAGARSKIAVYSHDENIDPIGACVGHKGLRVQSIVDELNNEKIDLVRWESDPVRYIANALSPSKVLSVAVNMAEKKSRVVVPDSQLSLAIGKEGQNARLTAKLTGWKIDIKSKTQAENTPLDESMLVYDVVDENEGE